MSGPISITVEGAGNLTNRYHSLQFSNVDPGGYETLQAGVTDLAQILPGAIIEVRYGLDVAWRGRVNEPGQRGRRGVDELSLAALGSGAALRDRAFRQIYMDRNLYHWEGPSGAQVIDRKTIGKEANVGRLEPRAWPALVDPLFLEAVGKLNQTEVWAFYDCGPDQQFDSVRISVIDSLVFTSADAANLDVYVESYSDDNTVAESSADQSAGLPVSSFIFNPTNKGRYAAVSWRYNVSAAGTDGVSYNVFFGGLAVVGRHGLPLRGRQILVSNREGYFASDIARHALGRSGAAILPGAVRPSHTSILAHAAYRELITGEEIIGQMAKQLAWHWGVWDAPGVSANADWLYFQPYPVDATAVVRRADCDELDVPKVRYDLLYDEVKVTYTDATGKQAYELVSRPLNVRRAPGVRPRRLEVNMGPGTDRTAQVFGAFALVISQNSARGGGSAILPAMVTTAGGGTMPACLLKSGRDRLRILDLPDAGSTTRTDTRRADTFRVSRVETTVDPSGVPKTRVEFDGGADLMEVLQAKLATANELAGA